MASTPAMAERSRGPADRPSRRAVLPRSGFTPRAPASSVTARGGATVTTIATAAPAAQADNSGLVTLSGASLTTSGTTRTRFSSAAPARRRPERRNALRHVQQRRDRALRFRRRRHQYDRAGDGRDHSRRLGDDDRPSPMASTPMARARRSTSPARRHVTTAGLDRRSGSTPALAAWSRPSTDRASRRVAWARPGSSLRARAPPSRVGGGATIVTQGAMPLRAAQADHGGLVTLNGASLTTSGNVRTRFS